MKKLLIILAILAMAIQAEAATLNLRATLTANTEPDMKEYKIYRTDGVRTLIGTVQHPTTTFTFPVTVADNTAGTLRFVVTALDTSGNESADSLPGTYPFELIKPAAPTNVIIIIQIP